MWQKCFLWCLKTLLNPSSAMRHKQPWGSHTFLIIPQEWLSSSDITAALSSCHLCICTSSAVLEPWGCFFPALPWHGAECTSNLLQMTLNRTIKHKQTSCHGLHSPSGYWCVLADVANAQIEQARSADIHQSTNPLYIKWSNKMNISWLLPSSPVVVMIFFFLWKE